MSGLGVVGMEPLREAGARDKEPKGGVWGHSVRKTKLFIFYVCGHECSCKHAWQAGAGVGRMHAAMARGGLAGVHAAMAPGG